MEQSQTKHWKWEYTGQGISAHGTLTTTATPDATGAYRITSLTGQRNGKKINGMEAAGTPIPGNEPYAVDDLLLSGSGAQLTGDGFGFSLEGGDYCNPFFADFMQPATYLEFFSQPPFVQGKPGLEDSELPIQFHAVPVE